MDIFDFIIPKCPQRPPQFMIILEKNICLMRINTIRQRLKDFSQDFTKSNDFQHLCRITKYLCEDLLVQERSPAFTISEASIIFNLFIDMINIALVAENYSELLPAFKILDDIENML